MLGAAAAWLENTNLSRYIAVSTWAFPTIETIHVLCLSALFGSIVLLDLRLIGASFNDRVISDLAGRILPITWAGFLGAALSGGLLLSSQATRYLDNPYLRLKMLTLALTAVNMLIFQLVIRRRVEGWDRLGAPPLVVRVAGFLSLCGWISTVALGRWIGFSLN